MALDQRGEDLCIRRRRAFCRLRTSHRFRHCRVHVRWPEAGFAARRTANRFGLRQLVAPHSCEIDAHLRCALIPHVAVLLERLRDEVLEIGGRRGFSCSGLTGRRRESDGRPLRRLSPETAECLLPSRRGPHQTKTDRFAHPDARLAPVPGDMYTAVPSVVPGLVRWTSPDIVARADALTGTAASSLASPKSRIFACRDVTKTLPGLMSRCTTPARCAASSASAMSRAIASSSSAAISRIGSASGRRSASSHSMAMNGWLACSAIS